MNHIKEKNSLKKKTRKNLIVYSLIFLTTGVILIIIFKRKSIVSYFLQSSLNNSKVDDIINISGGSIDSNNRFNLLQKISKKFNSITSHIRKNWLKQKSFDQKPIKKYFDQERMSKFVPRPKRTQTMANYIRQKEIQYKRDYDYWIENYKFFLLLNHIDKDYLGIQDKIVPPGFKIDSYNHFSNLDYSRFSGKKLAKFYDLYTKININSIYRMSLVSRNLIAVSGPGFQPTFFEKCRGKTAKEIYRCGKGIVVTRTFVGPVGFAFTQMGKEVATGVIYTAVGCAAETAIGYVSGVGFVRYIYKVSSIPKIKKAARICYNFAALPYTLYCRGIGELSNKIGISILEEKWFGEPVYIFNDNRVWIEKNFTLSDQF